MVMAKDSLIGNCSRLKGIVVSGNERYAKDEDVLSLVLADGDNGLNEIVSEFMDN